MALPPRFDALDPGVLADPYPHYADLRRSAPLARGGPGTWVVPRHHDVRALLTHPALTSSLPDEEGRAVTLFGEGPAGGLSTRMMSALTGTEHDVVRRVVHDAVSPPQLYEAVRRVVAPTVDELVERGEVDAVPDLALRIQVEVMCTVLGVPRDMSGDVWPDAVELGRIFIPYRSPGAAGLARADDLTAQLRAFVRGRMSVSKQHVGTGLLADLAAAVKRGELVEETAVDNAVFLFFAGFETTMNVMSTMCSLLAQYPEQFERLHREPSMVPTAVEEVIRFDSPSQYTIRLSKERLVVGDKVVRPGRMLLLLLGSANRDDEVFARPDQLDLGRQPNPHLAFGGGRHHCVGRGLGQLVCRSVLAELARRCRRLELSGEPERLPHPNFRAHRRLPVRLVVR